MIHLSCHPNLAVFPSEFLIEFPTVACAILASKASSTILP